MKKLLCVLSLCFVGCKSSSPVLSPIQDAGCAVETTISGGVGGAVSSALSCANAAQVSADLQAAFGNANLCAAPIPAQPAPVAGAVSAMVNDGWHKLGDIPLSALQSAKSGMSEQSVKPQGVIGGIACGAAINIAVGFLSNQVPASWKCSGPNATLSGLISTLQAACAAAIPL